MQTVSQNTQYQLKPEYASNKSFVRIAYFIIVHHQPERFKKLFEKLYTDDQFYLIHIDRKVKAEFTEEIQQFLIPFPNAYFLESININSGGFSIIEAELNAMEYLLNVSPNGTFSLILVVKIILLNPKVSSGNFSQKTKTKIICSTMIRNFTDQIPYEEYKNHFTELAYRISSFIYKKNS